MSEHQDAPEADPPQREDGTGADPATAVKRGTRILTAGIVALLLWSLLADRFTPYTNQARVQGYVVGVAPRVAGVVTEVWVDNNQQVAEGERLFRIDPEPYRIALDRAVSDLDNARRQVDAGSAAVAAAEARLAGAEANAVQARRNHERLARLREEDPGTVSLRQLEFAESSLDRAVAGVGAARAEVVRARDAMGGEDDGTNTVLRSARAAVAKAELDLAHTVVTAPSAGTITDLRADVGLYAGTGAPVMTLVPLHDVWVSAEFTENNLGHLTVGTPVEIVFDARPGEVYDGAVRSIGLGVSAGQPQASGSLPAIRNDRDWLRQAQRFPVVIGFGVDDPALRTQLRIGAQASVIAYPDGHGLLGLLGRGYIRLVAWLSYAY
jgi:multidrug resistance efflux pump